MTTSAVSLPLAERKRLIGVISNLYDFIEGPRNRRVFLQGTANLGRFVPSIDLAGDSRTVATDLVGKLEEFGELPERPMYHALGALLSAILGLGELPRNNATFLAGLIVRYSLVFDPAYIDKLRSEYAIADQAVRQPALTDVPVLPVENPPPGPAFVSDIRDEKALERVINSEDNFIDINLLIGAVYCSSAVCRIEVPKGKAQGTGFLVNTEWLLTNQHVLKNQSYLQDAVARFGYMLDASGEVTDPGKTFEVNPDFYFSSPAEELDYALVRLRAVPLQDVIAVGDELNLSMKELVKKGKHCGYLGLAGRNIRENDQLNIIQHPGGDFMKVVLTQNRVVKDMSPNRVQYVADTMDGSSGSPVFNRTWEVVALHHSGKPYPPDTVFGAAQKAWKGHFRSNEGIPMRTILEDFKQKGLLRYLP